MRANFEGTDIVVGYIYVKREEPLVADGFQKELQAVAVFGNKTIF